MYRKSDMIRLSSENGYFNLRHRLEFVLAVLEKEYEHAHTHAQRNSYAHVVRHEIEEILSDVTDILHDSVEEQSDIPF